MRSVLYGILAILIGQLVTPMSARGDIVISIDTNTFEPGTSFGTVDIFAHSDNADSLSTLTVDFELAGGVFLDPPGAFGEPDMIGVGNLNPASFFIRNSDRSASLSLDFISQHNFLTDDVILVSLHMDLRGLTDGFYPISIVDSSADRGLVNVVIRDFGHPGGVFIQSVPEPCSLGLCAIMAVVFFRPRRTQLPS